MFSRIQLSKNHYQIDGENFAATIKGNFRDAMASATITQLPHDPSEVSALIKHFIVYLRNEVGGKMLLRLSPELKETFADQPEITALFKQKLNKAPIKYISIQDLSNYVEPLRDNEKIQAIIHHPALQLLVYEQDYAGKYEQLYQFKRNHSRFNISLCGLKTSISKPLVSPEKIAAGLYSSDAEAEKIINEFVRHFAIYDSNTEEFLATFQVFIDNDLAYVSDVIVNENMRRMGLSQAIALQAFEALQQTHPQIQNVWLIGGGAGIDLLAPFFTRHQLPLTDLTPVAQQQLGLLPIFTPPKALLFEAGIKPMPTTTSNYVKNSLWAGAAVAALGAAAYATTVATHYFSEKTY